MALHQAVSSNGMRELAVFNAAVEGLQAVKIGLSAVLALQNLVLLHDVVESAWPTPSGDRPTNGELAITSNEAGRQLSDLN